jgi:hypothetical protein
MKERGGIGGMEQINDGVAERVVRRKERKEYTLMVDPTVIESAPLRLSAWWGNA